MAGLEKRTRSRCQDLGYCSLACVIIVVEVLNTNVKFRISIFQNTSLANDFKKSCIAHNGYQQF